MEPKDLISIDGIFSSGLVSIISILLAMKRHRELLRKEKERYEKQREREDKIREEDFSRELERTKTHREDIPHIEFDISCNPIGLHDKNFVVELLLMITNKGIVKQDIRSIKLRVRAIQNTDKLSFWKDNDFRLEFPNKLFDVEAIPKHWNFIFIEPNVKQIVSYITKIDRNICFITARAEFSYGQARKGSPGNKHSIERVFRLSKYIVNDSIKTDVDFATF